MSRIQILKNNNKSPHCVLSCSVAGIWIYELPKGENKTS